MMFLSTFNEYRVWAEEIQDKIYTITGSSSEMQSSKIQVRIGPKSQKLDTNQRTNLNISEFVDGFNSSPERQSFKTWVRMGPKSQNLHANQRIIRNVFVFVDGFNGAEKNRYHISVTILIIVMDITSLSIANSKHGLN